MADIDRGRETGAEYGCSDGANPIDRQGRSGGKAVTGGLGAFNILQRSHHVEQAHGQDHRQKGTEASSTHLLEPCYQITEHRQRNMESQGIKLPDHRLTADNQMTAPKITRYPRQLPPDHRAIPSENATCRSTP